MSVLCGDARQAQLANFSLLSDTLEELWVSVQVVPGHACQGGAAAVSSVGKRKSVLFLFRVQAFFFLKNPSPRDYSVKLLKQQLDFLWKK